MGGERRMGKGENLWRMEGVKEDVIIKERGE